MPERAFAPSALLTPATGLSDAEIVETCRREMQDIIDRTDFNAPTPEELRDSAGLPHRMVQLAALDLTEIGRFEVNLPPAATRGYPAIIAQTLRRHWVYRHKSGHVVTLQLSKRTQLKLVGYVVAPGFINDIGARS